MNPIDKIRIGTRASKLALKQTEMVSQWLLEKHPELIIEVVEITTKGDRILDVTLDKIGGKGVFIKEIEDALLEGKIDLAIHSMKDVPAYSVDGLTFAAFSAREDARDAFISQNKVKFSDLPAGSIVGSSSLRRKIQLEKINPNVSIEPIRGNVNTRLKKMEEQNLDGIILAAAGLIRLGLEDLITEYFEAEDVVPGVCQGIIGIQCRSADQLIVDLCRSINNTEAEILGKAERAFMTALNGNCQIPMGAYATLEKDQVTLTGMYGQGDRFVVLKDSGSVAASEKMGHDMGLKITSMMY